MTIGLAKELSPYGIVVNDIALGTTATSLLLNDGDKDINRAAHRLVDMTPPKE